MSKNKAVALALSIRELRIRFARQDFWEFCKLLEPDFYKESRSYLKKYCKTLQAFYERKLLKDDGTPYIKLMINMPPRHGKSRTLKNFTSWVLGINSNEKIITASYSDDQAMISSRACRDMIGMEKKQPIDLIYNEVFPNTKLSQGNASVQKWALEGKFFNYAGVGLEGGVTGRGCTLKICDDLIKDIEVALNEQAKDKIWLWYTGTFMSRDELNALEIMNMTRWASDDPCGRVLALEPEEWFVFQYNVEDEEGNLLCDEILSRQQLNRYKKMMEESVFEANYYNTLVDLKNKVFHLKTYKYHEINGMEFDYKISASDPSHGGGDAFSQPVAGIKGNFLYILDFLYDKKCSDSEYLSAEMLARNKVEYFRIENNNGGNVIGKNIQRILQTDFDYSCQFDYFTRTSSKDKTNTIAKGQKLPRILANAPKINNYVLFPEDFETRCKGAYDELFKFNRVKNKNDDAADSLTILYELFENGLIVDLA